MENYCENCGAKIQKDAQFCPECGLQVKQKLNTCPNCGKNIENSLNFCENCGTKINTLQIVTKKENIFEKYKNPIIILATVVIIAIIIAATLSFTAKPADVGTYTVTVGSNRFEIPGDYVVDPSTIDVDYTGYNVMFSQAYTNKDEIIFIGVMNVPYGVDAQQVVSSQGGVQKNLMGVNGYYSQDGNGYYTFAFVDGAYINVVTVSSPYILDQITYLG